MQNWMKYNMHSKVGYSRKVYWHLNISKITLKKKDKDAVKGENFDKTTEIRIRGPANSTGAGVIRVRTKRWNRKNTEKNT